MRISDFAGVGSNGWAVGELSLAAQALEWQGEEMGEASISVVVSDEGAIELPPNFGYEQGFRKGAGIRLRPVEVNGKPFDPTKRRSPALHLDDEHFLVTIGVVSRLKLYPPDVEEFGLLPGDEVLLELEEDSRSDEELEAAAKEWRQLHRVPELTDEEIAEIASEAMRQR